MKYKFIGKPDWRFPKLKTGKVYNLEITEESRGPLGFLVGNTCPFIRKPIVCPYSSWETFKENWKKIK